MASNSTHICPKCSTEHEGPICPNSPCRQYNAESICMYEHLASHYCPIHGTLSEMPVDPDGFENDPAYSTGWYS